MIMGISVRASCNSIQNSLIKMVQQQDIRCYQIQDIDDTRNTVPATMSRGGIKP